MLLPMQNWKRKRQIILTIYFEKCFDRISYGAIFGSMQYFGINKDSNFAKWVKLFFTDFVVCTQNSGFCSDWITKQRSINQGCPISPYLYLLCGKIFAHQILWNPRIKGITIRDIRLVLSQFADDTILYLNYDFGELNVVIQTLIYIEGQTGLKISYDKTTLYQIGSIHKTNAKLVTIHDLAWSDSDIQLLGC